MSTGFSGVNALKAMKLPVKDDANLVDKNKKNKWINNSTIKANAVAVKAFVEQDARLSMKDIARITRILEGSV